jgi:hypothetical protein
MATQYFRITAYHPAKDISVIMDTNGLFERIWQFSSMMIKEGFKVLEVSNDERFLDGNITKVEQLPENFIQRAYHTGEPEITTYKQGGVTYRAVKVGDKIYIPDREKKA